MNEAVKEPAECARRTVRYCPSKGTYADIRAPTDFGPVCAGPFLFAAMSQRRRNNACHTAFPLCRLPKGDLLALYYFHLRQADELISDEEGQEWPTLEKARAMAVGAARELVARAIKTGRDLEIYGIVMEDGTGQQTLVPLIEVIPQRFRG